MHAFVVKARVWFDFQITITTVAVRTAARWRTLSSGRAPTTSQCVNVAHCCTLSSHVIKPHTYPYYVIRVYTCMQVSRFSIISTIRLLVLSSKEDYMMFRRRGGGAYVFMCEQGSTPSRPRGRKAKNAARTYKPQWGSQFYVCYFWTRKSCEWIFLTDNKICLTLPVRYDVPICYVQFRMYILYRFFPMLDFI